jgi:CheY-like chemotaxis protein
VKKTVLIIDDSLPIRYLLEAILSKKYIVFSAGDGQSAMAWLRTGNMPDLIITDLQMPNINGWELIEYLGSSNLYQKIPVMILSGIINSKEIFQNKQQENVKGIITKPFDPVVLMEKVDGIFENRHAYIFS